MSWRTFVAAGLATALILVLLKTQHYATVIVLLALLAFTLYDATRLYSRLGATSLPSRTLDREQARQFDRMAGLLDTVTVALVALDAGGRISFANRAARLLAGEEVGRLSDIRALGPQAAKTIAALPAGARQIVTLPDGRTMLAWAGLIKAPGLPEQKLISLQAVSGELDAVQVKAWADMTRILSHEMMNSLTPISSLSEGLPNLIETGGAIEAAATIARRSRHLMNFVERYRRIADLPAPQIRSLDLLAFLADIDTPTRAHLAGRGIAWSFAGAEGTLNADPDLLHQAIVNLLQNAAEAAAKNSSPMVTLTVTREEQEIVFSVRDNGPGVSPDSLQEIFVPFFTTKPNGSGIGLTLARQIALAHGGRISVEPNGGQGATFAISLPHRE